MVPTRDHDTIRAWAARHGAVPAQIKPAIFDSQPAILYFLIGKASRGTQELQPISWDNFFAIFGLLELAFAYDEGSTRFDLVQIEKQSGAQAEH